MMIFFIDTWHDVSIPLLDCHCPLLFLNACSFFQISRFNHEQETRTAGEVGREGNRGGGSEAEDRTAGGHRCCRSCCSEEWPANPVFPSTICFTVKHKFSFVYTSRPQRRFAVNRNSRFATRVPDFDKPHIVAWINIHDLLFVFPILSNLSICFLNRFSVSNSQLNLY